MNRFIVGLDLGQAQDFTALAVVECVGEDYHVRHLERLRLGTPYPAIVEHVFGLLAREPLRGNSALVVDATGVGAPVVDLLRKAGLRPIAVSITSGDKVTHEANTWRVPKRDLLAALQVLLQSGKVKGAESLPEARTLVQELLAFKVKITDAAHDTYGVWREGQHDDLVLAAALATWWAQRTGRRPQEEELPGYDLSYRLGLTTARVVDHPVANDTYYSLRGGVAAEEEPRPRHRIVRV